MASNFLIAIGGRGSQCLEAAVYLCAMGCGPDDLEVLIIDPDDANNNFSRTNSLIDAYQKLHALESDKGKIFKTKITPNTKDKRKWSYVSGEKNKLKGILGEPTTDTGGADLRKLFLTEAELELDLKEGFKGHPVIGATIFGSIDLKEEEKPKARSSLGRFVGELRSQLANQPCNLFFIGSLFGGTGAAGLPTFAKKIVDHLKNEKANMTNLRIGGVFTAPYFIFTADIQVPQGLYAKSEHFLLNTQAVLANYDHLIRGVYNTVYLIGEQDMVHYGNFSTGGKSQNNKAHFVELVAGASALEFFSGEHKKNIKTSEKAPEIFLWARYGGKDNQGAEQVNLLDWDCFKKEDGGGLTIKDHMVKFTMLYLAFMKFFDKKLDKVIKGKKVSLLFDPEPWANQFDKKDEHDRLNTKKNIESFETLRMFFTGAKDEAGYGYLNWVLDILTNSGKVKVEILYQNFDQANHLYILDPKRQPQLTADQAYNDLYISFVEKKAPQGVKGASKFLYMLNEAVEEIHKKHYV